MTQDNGFGEKLLREASHGKNTSAVQLQRLVDDLTSKLAEIDKWKERATRLEQQLTDVGPKFLRDAIYLMTAKKPHDVILRKMEAAYQAFMGIPYEESTEIWRTDEMHIHHNASKLAETLIALGARNFWIDMRRSGDADVGTTGDDMYRIVLKPSPSAADLLQQTKDCAAWLKRAQPLSAPVHEVVEHLRVLDADLCSGRALVLEYSEDLGFEKDAPMRSTGVYTLTVTAQYAPKDVPNNGV